MWGYHYDETCGASPPGPEDWPSEPFSASLHRVLALRVLRLCYRSDRGGSQLNIRTDPPSGTFADFVDRLVSTMGVGLGLEEGELEVKYVLRSSHDECWAAVLDGEADAYGPNVDLGTASANGAAAVQLLEPSCSLYESNDMYGVLPGSRMYTYQDMHAHARRLLANGTTPRIYIGGPFDWWPDVEPWLWPEGTDVVNAMTNQPDSTLRSQIALDGLVNGTWMAIRLALVPGLWSGPPPPQVVAGLGIQAVVGQLSAGKATYFRREDDEQPSCGRTCLKCDSQDQCLSCVPNAESDGVGRCRCIAGYVENMFACVGTLNSAPAATPTIPSPTVVAPVSPPKGDASNTGAIVGGVVTAVALITISIALVTPRIRAKRRGEKPQFTNPPPDNVEA